MIVGDDSYTWVPNFLKYKDPETKNFLGNVVGNTPLELQLEEINSVGSEQLEAIQAEGELQITAVKTLADKYTAVWNIMNSVTNEILIEFGGSFILEYTALDSGILY